jgi:serine/threonine protein kinase
MNSQRDDYKKNLASLTVDVIAEILLNKANLALLDKKSSPRGERRAFESQRYFLSKTIATLVDQLNSYKRDPRADPFEIIKSVRQETQAWLEREIKKTKMATVPAFTKQIISSPASSVQHVIYAALNQLTTTLEKINQYDNPKVLAEFLDKLTQHNIIVDTAITKVDILASQIKRSEPVVKMKRPVKADKTIKLPYLNPKIKLTDLNIVKGEDIQFAKLKSDKIDNSISIQNGDDKYNIYKEGKLGEGSFGKVMLAQHDKTGEWIAIKQVKLVVFPFEKEAVEAEVNKLKQTQQFIFKINTQKQAFIGMPLQKGEELYNAINAQVNNASAFSTMQMLYICKSMLKEAADIHNAKAAIVNPSLKGSVNKIIHRDIKPENTMLMEDLSVRFIDFGLSAEVSNKKSGVIDHKGIGTSIFMAPEIRKQGAAYTDKSDVYALGVSFLTMLTGNTYVNDDGKSVSKPNPADYPELFDMMVLINKMLEEKTVDRIDVNAAYARINNINNKYAAKNEDKDSLKIFALKIENIISLMHANKLNELAEDLNRSGANSIVFIKNDATAVPQEEIIYAKRIFQDLGIMHFAPEIFSGVNSSVAIDSAKLHYNVLFGTADSQIHSAEDRVSLLLDDSVLIIPSLHESEDLLAELSVQALEKINHLVGNLLVIGSARTEADELYINIQGDRRDIAFFSAHLKKLDIPHAVTYDAPCRISIDPYCMDDNLINKINSYVLNRNALECLDKMAGKKLFISTDAGYCGTLALKDAISLTSKLKTYSIPHTREDSPDGRIKLLIAKSGMTQEVIDKSNNSYIRFGKLFENKPKMVEPNKSVNENSKGGSHLR